MGATQQSGIVPVVIAPTRPNVDAIFEMVFGNQQHALDREVIGPEGCLAGIEVSTIANLVRVIAFSHKVEGFVAAVAVACAMAEESTHPKVGALDSIDRTADPSRIRRRKRNNDLFIINVTTFP